MLARHITQSAGTVSHWETGKGAGGVLGKIEHIWNSITGGKVFHVRPQKHHRNYMESNDIFDHGCFRLKRRNQKAKEIVLYNISYLAKVNTKFNHRHGARSLTYSSVKTVKLTRCLPKAFGPPVGALKPLSDPSKVSY